MDNIIGILLTMLDSQAEHSDEQIMTFIRDHQEELHRVLRDEHRIAAHPTSLQLATFDDIFEEMKARTVSLLVAAEVDRKDTTKVTVQYHGGLVSALGLVNYAQNELQGIQGLSDGEDDDISDEEDDEEDPE